MAGPSNGVALQRQTSRDSTGKRALEDDDNILGCQSTNNTTDSELQDGYIEHIPDSRQYRVYKSRFFGLAQLVLLNVIISWDWLTYASVSDTASDFFNTTESVINWLSTAFLLAFVVSAPATIWVLKHYGPKVSILVASGLVLAGNWVRYAGTVTDNGYFGVVMAGQILIGLAQPFVLAAPTRYSQLWFSDQGRITATAVASLANPLGGALGQLISPVLADKVSQIPDMVLYVTVISSAATIPAPFIPARPPTPPSATAALEKLDLAEALHELPRNGSFYLVLIPFAVYVACFNSTSSLINQIFEPYGLSETDAGIAGGLLIIVGLVTSAVVSPIIDKTKTYLLAIKIIIPMIAGLYIDLIWMPGTRQLVGPYIVCSLLGATSFSLLPIALEVLSIITLPVSPEVSSVIGWSGGQLLGGVFIIIMDQLQGGWSGEPSDSLKRGLVFQAAIACAVVPIPMFLGVWKFRRIVWNPAGYMETRSPNTHSMRGIEQTKDTGSAHSLNALLEVPRSRSGERQH